jgi:excisionase family DNA binding protein
VTGKHAAIGQDEVCTTQRAAELLGISVSSVQQLVESGEIPAWKTRGGHRRIPLQAVLAYRASPAAPAAAPAVPVLPPAQAAVRGDELPRVLVVEDNPLQRAVYQRQFESWSLPLQLAFCDNGYQALMEIARRPPDLLLADIMMEGIDGYEVVRTILADQQLRATHVAIVSGMAQHELDERGGVPDGVVYFSKPVNFDELRGYVRACCAQVVRAQRIK